MGGHYPLARRPASPRGDHLIKAWSVTQGVIFLSSSEAEFYGIAQGSSVGLGVQNILGDIGLRPGLQLETDSSAAKGITSRRGLGKVRHVEFRQFWVQENMANRCIGVMQGTW